MKALDKKKLWKEIKRQHRRETKEKIASLKEAIRGARRRRKDAIREAKTRCKTERLAARERARALRVRLLVELRQAVKNERAAARQSCSVQIAEARQIKDDVERARAKLEAERKYQAELRRIELANKQRRKEETPSRRRGEKRSESDDEVRSNIPSELVPLFERVKGAVRGSDRMSRTEAFLKFAEEHPNDVLEAIDDKTESMIRELEQKEREARRELRRGPPRRKFTAEELAQTPF